MPSFFEGLKRMIQGKPVFEESDHAAKTSQHDSQPQAPAADGKPQPATPRDERGQKVMPVAFIKEIRCTEKGEKDMECWSVIRNDSPQPLELDKVIILGVKRELDMPMQPGQERQFLLYSGPRPSDEHKNVCELHYFDTDHDYFAAIHDVRFEWHPDKTYTVSDVELRHPIKDIYG